MTHLSQIPPAEFEKRSSPLDHKPSSPSAAVLPSLHADLRIIRLPEVSVLTGLGRGAIYKRLKDDAAFPRPVRLSDSNSRGAPVGWVLSEVQGWVLSRMTKRDEVA